MDAEADFVIVGSGAGGATAARVLSDAGHSVIVLEEGPWLRTADRPRSMLASWSQSLRGFGTTTTTGGVPMPLLQGRCVGGSTAINCGIIWRMPEDVRQLWQRSFGLAELVDERAQERIFTQLERELEVDETSSAVWGGNEHLMHEASRRLGLPGRAIVRNARRCEGKGQCLMGCPIEARQSMDVSYIPRAQQHGATILPLARVQRVLTRSGRAVGVVGHWLDAEDRHRRKPFRIGAKRAVVVAAGAVHTSVLLRASGLRHRVGEGFRAHPGAAVIGRFAHPVGMSFGATQGYEVPMREQGFKLESLLAPPELLAARIPGTGLEWQERLSELDHYAQWVAQVRMHAVGRVRPGWFSEPQVRFVPTPRDLETVRNAIVLLCRMMFEVGAIEVYSSLVNQPAVLTDIDQVGAIERHPLRLADVHLVASHLFGTACAGSDPRSSVVGPDLQCHQLPGLYVCDASVFPTNLGVNPQHSIMAVAWRAMERLAS